MLSQCLLQISTKFLTKYDNPKGLFFYFFIFLFSPRHSPLDPLLGSKSRLHDPIRQNRESSNLEELQLGIEPDSFNFLCHFIFLSIG